MTEKRVLTAPLDEDLASFSLYLWQQRIPHRIVEQGDRQVLWVADAVHAARAEQLYRQLKSGDLRLERKGGTHRWFDWSAVVSQLGGAPVTVLLVLLSVIGYLLVTYDRDYSLVSWLTYFDFERQGGSIVWSVPPEQLWRLITPIFLHFSALHIVFNMLWLWELGRRIEHKEGSLRYSAIVLAIGLGSNVIQSVFSQVGIFGGMSGVIYGLLGFCWLWSFWRPRDSYHIRPAVIGVMIGWLVLCFFGFAALLGAGAVANAAHVGGLLVGMLLGTLAALLAGRQRKLG